MKIRFHKYHGTGNDFIIIDCRNKRLSLSGKQIEQLCHRHFGIGADGLMTLNHSGEYDFEMKYYNADGNEGSMCGNGGRSISLFAYHLGITKNQGKFIAIDGEHEFEIHSASSQSGMISIKMGDVTGYKQFDNEYFINTGSPHLIRFSNNLEEIDIYTEGRKLRWAEQFQPEGTNVNFVEQNKNKLTVRTFERGVENITLSCGTGAVAAALAASNHYKDEGNKFTIETYGGELNVKFRKTNQGFEDIWLKGEAMKAYEGQIDI